MLDAKTVQGQERYFDNKSSQSAAVAEKKQQEVKVESRSYEARAKKFTAQPQTLTSTRFGPFN